MRLFLVGDLIVEFSNWIWDIPMLASLMGGGFILFVYSGFVPFRYFRHAHLGVVWL
jgi:AGCS family alanine or glycine:cation symporter